MFSGLYQTCSIISDTTKPQGGIFNYCVDDHQAVRQPYSRGLSVKGSVVPHHKAQLCRKSLIEHGPPGASRAPDSVKWLRSDFEFCFLRWHSSLWGYWPRFYWGFTYWDSMKLQEVHPDYHLPQTDQAQQRWCWVELNTVAGLLLPSEFTHTFS